MPHHIGNYLQPAEFYRGDKIKSNKHSKIYSGSSEKLMVPATIKGQTAIYWSLK